jgi:hypothetical protein
MMSKKKNNTIYYHSSMYLEFLEEYKRRKLNFSLEQTSYTKTIKLEDKRLMFNQDGASDWRVLSLINKTRSDANKYLECLLICDEKDMLLRDTYINFYKLFEKPTLQQEIVKVDLKSAYWKYALRRGIITEETDNTFKKLFKFENNKEAKNARLKALGSLATSKRVIDYVNGVANYDSEKLLIEPTKPLYLEICRGVDELMRECREEIPGVYYYYWDCIFVSKEFSKEAIDFFASRDYNVNVDEDKIEFVEHMGNSYIVSTKNDKCYMVREEDKNLAAWIKEKNGHFNEDYLTNEFH